MNILVTGAKGFVGRNLCESLKNIRDRRDSTRPNVTIGQVFEYDADDSPALLEGYCATCDFVFHLAGVNRSTDSGEFIRVNYGFTCKLLDTLKKHNNTCPVMISSSIQASCVGRYDNDYGRSKRIGEDLVFAFGEMTGAKVLVYRLPNLFGKWCRPNYNSVVATFCHNTANDLPLDVDDRSTALELVYIDDLVAEMLDALEGREHRNPSDSRFCAVPTTHNVKLGEIVDLLERFAAQPSTLVVPEMPDGSFAKKLYSTYVSYLPREKIKFPLKTHRDSRGSFTEVLRSPSCGQFSVNVAKPGVTKGQHWHHSKWEIFVVVSGRALIQLRKVGCDELLSFEVSGDTPEAVQMLPGYTHCITNLSATDDLVTLIWANERFNAERPDTFGEAVE